MFWNDRYFPSVICQHRFRTVRPHQLNSLDSMGAEPRPGGLKFEKKKNVVLY
jgi:hypothetical protein